MVAAGSHRTIAAAVADDDNGLDDTGDGARGVDCRLEREELAAALAAVGGDDDSRPRVDNAPGDRFRREAGEHDRMHRADPRTGEHRHRRFRDHR